MKYEYKNNIYIVVNADAKLKLSGMWVEAVIYKRENEDQLYVRNAVDFQRKFKQVQ